MIGRARRNELDEVVELIVAEQARPERNIIYLGVEARGVRAELAALVPDWATTLRVVRHGGRTSEGIIGAVVTEWDDELGRSWIHGP